MTLNARDCSKEDVRRLRDTGLSDADILDIVHIIGFFNHINRLADALGVEPEPFMIRDDQTEKT